MTLYNQSNSRYQKPDDVYNSTFKHDYINANDKNKQAQIVPPAPAEILHKDHNLNMSTSISMAREGYSPVDYTTITKPVKKELTFSSSIKLGDNIKNVIDGRTVNSTFF